MTYAQAATLPVSYITAYHGLVQQVRVTDADTVLVMAAGSGIGAAAIQIARHLGARVIATTGADWKARRAEELGLASPVAGEGVLLMAQNWRYSSAKARRGLGYRARPLDRPLRGGGWQYAYTLGGPARDLAMDTADNAAGAAKCVVLDPGFDWGDDRRPGIPLEDTVFYELHVRGFTKLMNEVPEGLRGTFSGLGSEPAIEAGASAGTVQCGFGRRPRGQVRRALVVQPVNRAEQTLGPV